MVLKKNQIIAKEGILTYPEFGRIYKPWDELRKFIGKSVRVLHTHDGEEIGRAVIKQCPIGKNLLCADIEYDERTATETTGYSIGTLSEILETPGTFGTDTYDKIQKIHDIDHIALTNYPRDRNALSDAEKRENRIILHDSYEFTEEKKMEEKTQDVSAIQKMYDDLKSKFEQISNENAKLKEIVDSFEKAERERLVSSIMKHIPDIKLDDSYSLHTLRFGASLLDKYIESTTKIKDEDPIRPIEKIIKKIEGDTDIFDPLAIYKPKEGISW